MQVNSHVLDLMKRREATRVTQEKIKKDAQHQAAQR